MDIRMPECDGYEATAQIRGIKRSDAASIPIYAMTANAFEEDIRRAKEVGMTGHFAKPVDMLALCDKLQEQKRQKESTNTHA
jgi:CheY-like chemotaxis protein